jgi:DNA-binding MarR family transcriptional regulator
MNECEGDKSQTYDTYELIQALMRAGKYTEMQLDAALASTGLSAAKWNALRHLINAGGQLPLGQLAAKLSCVKSNATQLVDRLEAENLVCRLPDPDDRRSVRAEITAGGRRAYEMGQRVVEEFEQQLLEDYSLEERFVLNRLLTRLSGGQNCQS